jgi:hypothetical protein
MSEREDLSLLRSLWEPFFVDGLGRNASILRDFASEECWGKEHKKLEGLISCVQEEGAVKRCLESTINMVVKDWLLLSPETRSHVKELAEKYPNKFPALPDLVSGDQGRVQIPWHLANALFDEYRRKYYAALIEMGVDLENQTFARQDGYGLGDVQLALPKKLDDLLAKKIDLYIAAIVIAQPTARKFAEDDVKGRADGDSATWLQEVHETWQANNRQVPDWVVSETCAMFDKRIAKIPETQPSRESMDAIRALHTPRTAAPSSSERPGPAEDAKRWFVRPFTWVGGALLAGVAAALTASITGVFNHVIPAPSDIACTVSYHFEKRAPDDKFTILVRPFRGETDGKYSGRVVDAIRAGTGLSVSQTCKKPSYPAGSYIDVDKAVGQQGMDELKAHKADVVIWGEVSPGEDTVDLHYRNEFGLESSPYRHDLVKVAKLGRWLDPNCVRNVKEDPKQDDGTGCFLGGTGPIASSEFSTAVFDSMSATIGFSPGIKDNPDVLLRLANKISNLKGDSFGGGQSWTALTSYERHTGSAVEGYLRSLYACQRHDPKQAMEGLTLVSQAFEDEGSAPSWGETQYWEIFRNVAMECAVRETKDPSISDQFVTLAQSEIKPPPLSGHYRLGTALVLRWQIRHNPEDLKAGVSNLRTALHEDRQIGSPDASTEEYNELLTLKQQGAIPSID